MNDYYAGGWFLPGWMPEDALDIKAAYEAERDRLVSDLRDEYSLIALEFEYINGWCSE